MSAIINVKFLGEPLSDFGYIPIDEYMQNNSKNVGMILFKPNVQVCQISFHFKVFMNIDIRGFFLRRLLYNNYDEKFRQSNHI